MTDNTTTLSGPPPGWYTDPRGTQRWWDGQGWTAHVAPAAPAAPAPSPPVQPVAAPVAAPAMPAAVTAPAAPTGPPVAPGSMDLLPNAPAAKASRRMSKGSVPKVSMPKGSMPKLSVPQLSRRTWIGVGAALIAVVAGAFYLTRGGDDSADASAVPVHVAAPALPAKSGAILTAKQATAALPAASALGAGWAIDANKTVNASAGLDSSTSVTKPASCGKLLDTIGPGVSTGKALATAGRSYSSAATHAFAGVAVVTYKAPVPAASLTAASKLLPGCKSFTVDGAAKLGISSVTFPALGQGAVYVRMVTTVGTATVPFDTMMVRDGHNLVLVEMIGKTSNPAAMAAVAKAALARLPH